MQELDITHEIERYLRKGKSDPFHPSWPGQNILESTRNARETLLGALAEEVLQRSQSNPAPTTPCDFNAVSFTRNKVESMIRGLFPRNEQEAVLKLVERSVVFLTPDSIEEVLRECRWLKSAWDIANLFLGSIDAELLSEEAPNIVGLNEEVTCYVSTAYFEEKNPFSDFIVHEVAHIFHNCKRRVVGLRETKRREWLLDLAFRKRETFAYACEVYARIVERSRRLQDRVELADEFGLGFRAHDDRVDDSEVVEIVREASGRRNGWKVILKRCSPQKAACSS